MTFYFSAGEMGGYFPSDSTFVESASGSPSTFDSGFARCSLNATQAAQYGQSAAYSLPDEFYARFDWLNGSGNSVTSTMIEFLAGTTGLFRVVFTSATSSYQMQARISGSYANVGNPVVVGSGKQTIDLYVDGNSASGTAKLYVAGTLRETASSVNLSAVTAITNHRHYGCSDDLSASRVSQVIIADEPTIGMRLMTIYASGAGATSQFIGSYTGIDETVYSDSDFIYSDTNGDVSLFTGTSVGSLTGYVVRAVGVYARAKKGAAGPSNLQLALRTGGTTYTSASKALDVGYGAYGNIWETNPSTLVDWLSGDISALQFGVKAVT